MKRNWFGAIATIVQGILVITIVVVVVFFWPDNSKVIGVNTNTIGLHNDILADHEARLKELEGR